MQCPGAEYSRYAQSKNTVESLFERISVNDMKCIRQQNVSRGWTNEAETTLYEFTALART